VNRQLKRTLASIGGAKGKVYRSFRHLYELIAREYGIGEEIHDALTGHKSGSSEGRGYGKGSYPEEPLFEGMKQFKISGFDFSHCGLRALRPYVSTVRCRTVS
jgi:hypothetical protein